LQEVSSQEYAFAATETRGLDTTWGTYNFGGSIGSNWAYVRVVTTWLTLNYIKFAIKSTITSYVRATTTRLKSNHIKFTITIIATSDNIVVVTRVEINLSTNNCTIVNIGIKRATIDFVYNRKLTVLQSKIHAEQIIVKIKQIVI
jgi:hypothetical protein